MNTVTLTGRLTKQAEIVYLTNGQLAKFTIAVDKNMTKEKKQELESKNQPTADFINCVAFGRLADNISKYTDKGLRVIVNGSIQTGSYEKNGQKVYTTDVLVNNVEFIDWKNSKNDQKNEYEELSNYNIPF